MTALQTCGSTSSASQSEAPPAWWMGVIQLAEKISSKSELILLISLKTFADLQCPVPDR